MVFLSSTVALVFLQTLLHAPNVTVMVSGILFLFVIFDGVYGIKQSKSQHNKYKVWQKLVGSGSPYTVGIQF